MANDDIASPSLIIPLAAGAFAGTAADTILFPLDTVKTRLQSTNGLWASGGFRRIYAGILPAVLGSAPTAAVFFCSYEFGKRIGSAALPSSAAQWPIHAFAAAFGETTACIVRVPIEVLKQRTQATTRTSAQHLQSIWHGEGVRGFYRGYWSTVLRDIPFSALQFPIWELLKRAYSVWNYGRIVEPWQSAVCGSASGAAAALLTTPLDVAKTRIMLAERGSTAARGSIMGVMLTIFRSGGLRALFSGAVPRTLWISIGGFIFLGGYDFARTTLSKIVCM